MILDNFIMNSRRILSCYYYNLLELFAVKTALFYKILMNWREPVFLNEIKMAHISMEDNVLLIGSGIFPSEVMMIANQTGAKVTGIDNSIKAVKLSKDFLKKKYNSKNIVIKYADGENISLHDFDIIFIAINVFPISKVLRNISNQVAVGTKIMCKSIKQDIPLVLKNEKLDSIFEVMDHLKNPRTQSYLLVKKQ